MTIVHVDSSLPPDGVRFRLYSGDFVLFTGLTAVAEFVEFARSEIEKAFHPHDPQAIHTVLDSEETARILGSWKPYFIHHERSKTLTRAIIEQAGFDPTSTHYDVPKPRTAFPSDHLTTGIAFAFPWHRDTWYAAPQQQINWWLPIWEPLATNAMAFDPAAFDRAVPNDSGTLDYYQTNKDRLSAAQHVKSDPRSRPSAEGWTPDAEVVFLPRPGQVLLFSGSQLHRTIPNTSGRSRYSIDFRTVDRPDVESGLGAPRRDVACTGTALRDFACVSTGLPIDEATVRFVEGAPPPEGAILVFDAGVDANCVGEVA